MSRGDLLVNIPYFKQDVFQAKLPHAEPVFHDAAIGARGGEVGVVDTLSHPVSTRSVVADNNLLVTCGAFAKGDGAAPNFFYLSPHNLKINQQLSMKQLCFLTTSQEVYLGIVTSYSSSPLLGERSDIASRPILNLVVPGINIRPAARQMVSAIPGVRTTNLPNILTYPGGVG